MEGAGIVGAYVSASGIAASSGLRAFEERSRAQFSLTATAADSSGWVSASSRSFADLDVARRAATAIEKARASAAPREIPAGRYTVILEPAAAAGFVGPLFSAFEAKSYFKGTSPLANKLGERVIDEQLTLQNRPDHPALMGDGFDRQGLPGDWQTWIERGVLRSLAYDRFTAQERGAAPTAELDAPHLSGTNPAGASVEELVRGTRRGVLVTNFWYIRDVNRTDLTLTGMTRDGTFLIEDGRIAGGLINFRWHDSPLRGLNALDGYSSPLEAVTLEREKMMLPALRIRDFHFSSVTRF
jgi:predicted Zn-dependent protease